VSGLGSQSSGGATLSARLSPGNVAVSAVSNKRFRRSASMICTQLSGIVLSHMFVISLAVCHCFYVGCLYSEFLALQITTVIIIAQ